LTSQVKQLVSDLSQVAHLLAQTIGLAEPTATSSTKADLAVYSGILQAGGSILSPAQVIQLFGS
jgi:hypothetical protein